MEKQTTEFCRMPKELTAENGAKALLTGEFFERREIECPECADDQYPDNCKACDGTGYMTESTLISWDNIKKIYAMAVKHLAQES